MISQTVCSTVLRVNSLEQIDIGALVHATPCSAPHYFDNHLVIRLLCYVESHTSLTKEKTNRHSSTIA